MAQVQHAISELMAAWHLDASSWSQRSRKRAMRTACYNMQCAYDAVDWLLGSHSHCAQSVLGSDGIACLKQFQQCWEQANLPTYCCRYRKVTSPCQTVGSTHAADEGSKSDAESPSSVPEFPDDKADVGYDHATCVSF